MKSEETLRMQNEKALDKAMNKFTEEHHIWEVLRYLLEVVSIQNRENKEMGKYIKHLHDVLEEITLEKCDISGRSFEERLRRYDFYLSAKELTVLRKSRYIYNSFMKLNRKLPRETN